MNSLDKETKRVIVILFTLGIALILASYLSGCSQAYVMEGQPSPSPSPTPSSSSSLVSTTIPATHEQCPKGGTIVLVAEDTDKTGEWAADDKNQISVTVCNKEGNDHDD